MHASTIVGLALVGTFAHFADAAGGPNFKCKNASSDWPQPCVAPKDALTGMRMRKAFPITAWWPPDSSSHNPEVDAYAAAGFNIMMLGDRGPQRCQSDASSASDPVAESWSFVKRQIRFSHDVLNMTAWIDTYRCLPWGSNATVADNNTGGAWQSSAGGGWVPPIPHNHKITL